MRLWSHQIGRRHRMCSTVVDERAFQVDLPRLHLPHCVGVSEIVEAWLWYRAARGSGRSGWRSPSSGTH
jgi:hypothetical protein